MQYWLGVCPFGEVEVSECVRVCVCASLFLTSYVLVHIYSFVNVRTHACMFTWFCICKYDLWFSKLLSVWRFLMKWGGKTWTNQEKERTKGSLHERLQAYLIYSFLSLVELETSSCSTNALITLTVCFSVQAFESEASFEHITLLLVLLLPCSENELYACTRA